MKIVVDMMGGDHGLNTTIPAVKEFVKLHPDAELFLAGDAESLKKEFTESDKLHICPSETVLPMDVDPMRALKDKKSSLMVGVQAYLDNGGEALVSAGSTGAVLSAAVFKIKRIEGISRPGLVTPMPTGIKGKYCVALDLGANNANSKEDLLNFAIMGSIYYSVRFGKENPEVYLLSNGTEEEKGSPLNKEAFPLLKDCEVINFKGNCEGRDPVYGKVDVLVTDGYSGNVFLKTMEGTAKMMGNLMKKGFKKNLFTKIGYLFAKSGVAEIKETMDYKNVGGAMLLGVNGVVLKTHGNSEAKTFLSTLNNAYDLVSFDLVNKIKKGLKNVQTN